VCSNTWNLIQDAINQWVADQHAANRTDAQIKADLASYDQWDRNDFDHDGNFNEPDGYIDHFQIVHSGGDQADGDPFQGEDAIWSHRWKAYQGSRQGPANNPDGGTQIGATGLWIADYTIQPENGGISVFAHEYGHDLGLPDEYDTAAAVDTAVNWWTLMSQSRTSAATDQGIGTRAADLGAWDKLQLGWLDYEIVVAGQNKTLDLGPHEGNTAKAQGVVVVLPRKTVTTPLGAPAAGTKQWYSGTGDDYDASLARQVAVPSGTTTLSFQARWNIEDCGPDPCDYAFVEVNDGSGYKAIPGSITKAAEGNGIDGVSGGWKPATFDLSAYANKTVTLRFHYKTDPAQQGDPDSTEPPGIFVDEIKLTNGTQTLFTDGAENGANGWAATGFSIVGATSS
jgi:immune inhibitor A